MKGRLVLLVSVLCALSLLLSGAAMAESAGGAYNEVVRIMDWGPATTKVVVAMGETLDAQEIPLDAFTVHVERIDERVEEPLLGEGEREITAAYVSDAEGNRADSGEYVALEMVSTMTDGLSSPMNYFEGTNVWIQCPYTITQQKDVGGVSGIVADTLGETYKPDLAMFDMTGTIDDGTTQLTYASYVPAGAYDGADLPLIIWLHGGGEGGTDPSVALSANRACAFASDEVQAYFGGAAYVLAPQTPTAWMDDGTDTPFLDKTESTSLYTDALLNLIDAYVTDNPGIDTDRIYLGGCSNGGYMTMLAILERPDYFAAAFPICEAVLDSTITDEALETLVDMPIWFIHAADDTTVPAPITALATYDRLIKLGAENVELFYPKYVVDLSGINGEGFHYPGHWSWIYAYNNDVFTEIDGSTVTLMEWLAGQSK